MGANTPVPLEYLAANGDSGGPLYISDGGVQKVAGLVSYGGSPIDGFFNASYGDTAFFTRVSSFNAWIDDQLSARYWNNASGGAFSTGANWIEGSAPDSTNIAVFNLAGTYSVTLGSSITNKRVRVRAGNVTMNLSGATYTLGSSTLENSLTVGKTASDNASLTISNGTISVVNVGIGESSPAIGSLIIDGAGALAASSTIAVGGTPNATGGTGTLQINSTGLAQINGGMHVYSAGRVINNGSIAWTGGAIQMNSGAILNNNSGAILDVQGNLSLSTLGGSPSLINAGTIRKSAGAGLSAVSVPFTNTGTIQVQSGSMSFIGAGTNNGGTLLTSATTRIDFNGTNSVTFSNASTITGSGVVGFGSLVSNTGTLKIDTTALLIASGTLNNSGTVDLNGKLILDYTGSSPISTIKSQIATGFASGAWTGSGIKSTSAAANASSLHKTAIGYADASSVPLSSFGGQSVDPTSLLLRYTAYGDANLDGTVNTSDFTMLGQNFNKSSTFWNFGDFNYDGTVNALDFNAMASNFGFVLPSDPLDLGAPSLGALVPEPTSLALGAALVFGIRRRRLR
jgi:hypothetical protein